MLWKCLPFESLTPGLLYKILQARVDIFVVEQKCAYPELDNKDLHPQTLHLIAVENDKVIAYARLLPPNLSYPSVSIGRVLTVSGYRGKGLGYELLEKALSHCEHTWPGADIEIGAQEHLQQFYERLGFTCTSTMYLEDGIPHLDMKLRK